MSRKFLQSDEPPTITAHVCARDVEGVVEGADPTRGAERGTAPAGSGVVVSTTSEQQQQQQQPASNRSPIEPTDAEMSGSSSDVALYEYRSGRLHVGGADDAIALTLQPREWELLTASPVQQHGGVRWAPLGLLTMLNGGGAITSSVLANGFGRPPTARTVLRATGVFGAYCHPAPRQVRVNGAPVDFGYDEESGLLRVNLERGAKLAELSVSWQRRGGGGAPEA